MVPIIRFKNTAYFLDCMGENEECTDSKSIEDKIATYKAFADMLELARNTEKYFIDIAEEDRTFIIRGKLNNFQFEYYTNHETGGVSVNNDRYNIDLETEGKLSQKVTRMMVQGREYTLDSVNGKDKKCDTCGEEIEEAEEEPWEKNGEKEETIEEKLTNGHLPDTNGMNGHEETTVQALHFGQALLKRVMEEINTKIPAFMEITKKYFTGKYKPEKNIPTDFTTNEEIFKGFQL